MSRSLHGAAGVGREACDIGVADRVQCCVASGLAERLLQGLEIVPGTSWICQSTGTPAMRGRVIDAEAEPRKTPSAASMATVSGTPAIAPSKAAMRLARRPMNQDRIMR